MDENVEQPVEAPMSTEDIATQALSESEGPQLETSVDTSVQPTSAQPTQEELSGAAKFLFEQGHKIKKEDGRPNWLPAPTIEKMLDRYAERQREIWAAEHHAPTVRERDQYKADLEEYVTALRGDPRQFLETISQHLPQYKSFLTPAEKKQIQQAEDPEPPPDVDLGNGRATYSLEGLKKRDEWRERQILAKMEEKLRPWQEREEQAKAQAEQAKRHEWVSGRAKSQMDEAQSWPMFGKFPEDGSLTEFQAKVLETMASNKEMSLHQAYMKVYTPLAAKMSDRAELVKEMNQAPKSTSVPRGNVEPAKSGKRRTTEDIAAEVLAKLNG